MSRDIWPPCFILRDWKVSNFVESIELGRCYFNNQTSAHVAVINLLLYYI